MPFVVLLSLLLANSAWAVRDGKPSDRAYVVEVLNGSGIAVDPYVVMTARHVVPTCKAGDTAVILDGKEVRPIYVSCGLGFDSGNGDPRGVLFSNLLKHSSDFAFLVFEKPLFKDVAKVEWGKTLETKSPAPGDDVFIVGFGPAALTRERLEVAAKLHKSERTDAISTISEKTDLRSFVSHMDEAFLEVRSNRGVGPQIQRGNSGGAIVDAQSGLVIGLVSAIWDLDMFAYDYGQALRLDSPMVRHRVRTLNERFPHVLSESSPLKNSPKVKELDARFYTVVKEVFAVSKRWSQKPAR